MPDLEGAVSEKDECGLQGRGLLAVLTQGVLAMGLSAGSEFEENLAFKILGTPPKRSSIMVQRKRIRLGTMQWQVRSLASISG